MYQLLVCLQTRLTLFSSREREREEGSGGSSSALLPQARPPLTPHEARPTEIECTCTLGKHRLGRRDTVSPGGAAGGGTAYKQGPGTRNGTTDHWIQPQTWATEIAPSAPQHLPLWIGDSNAPLACVNHRGFQLGMTLLKAEVPKLVQ